jgi:hypothetical protein
MNNKLASFLLAGVLIACEQKMTEKEPSQSVSLPMEIAYKGQPEIGSMKNVQTVMEWNKRLSELNLNLGDLLADTVTVHLAEGVEMTATRDSTLAFLKTFVMGMSKIEIHYTAAVPVNVMPQNDEWVFSWTDEKYTLKNGNVEHNFLHEDYRLEGGKIREVFQYSRKPAPSGIAEM